MSVFGLSSNKDKSDIYELDPTGKTPPKAFGLAPAFAGIDGIEILDDGTFLITDCHGHRVYTVVHFFLLLTSSFSRCMWPLPRPLTSQPNSKYRRMSSSLNMQKQSITTIGLPVAATILSGSRFLYGE